MQANRHIKEINPEKLKISPDVAYVFGVLCGDGSVRFKKARKYRVELVLRVNDWDFAKYFKEKLSKWIKYEIKIHKEKQQIDFKINGIKTKRKSFRYSVIFGTSDRNFYKFIKQFNFTTRNWYVPKEILQSNNGKILANFIKGFADSEGSVVKRSITLSSSNLEGLKQIIVLLRKIGITEEFGKIKIWNLNLTIYGRKNLETFLKVIGFSIKRKQKALENLVNKYEKNYCNSIASYKKVEELRNKGYKIIEISERMNIPYGTIHDWLSNRHKPLFVKRLNLEFNT